MKQSKNEKQFNKINNYDYMGDVFFEWMHRGRIF